jgi:tRNA pseudouridine38/39 synthase
MQSLDTLSKQQLIQKIHGLQACSPPLREFDWSKHGSRRIALRFAYNGAEYSGLASASATDTVRTVESEIFDALIKSRLIPDRLVTDFSRCGRTDKVFSNED